MILHGNKSLIQTLNLLEIVSMVSLHQVKLVTNTHNLNFFIKNS